MKKSATRASAGGVRGVVEALTDNRNHTATNVRTIFSRMVAISAQRARSPTASRGSTGQFPGFGRECR
jgi:hypothetical protein